MIALAIATAAIASACVFAVNAGAAKPALPKQVGSLKVRASSGTLTLSWKAPVNARKVRVTGYSISYKKASSKRWTKLKPLSAKERRYRLKRLKNGSTYKLRIAALSRGGVGKARTITAIPRKRGVGGLGSGPTLTAPGAPQNFAVAAGMGRVSADWTAPSVDGGSKVTGYELRYRIVPDGAWSSVSTPANEPGTTVAGLTPQVLYELSVRAVNSVGAGAWTAPLTTEPLPVMAVPSEPLNLEATGGLSKITLDWDPPASEGDAPVTLYELRGRAVGAATWGAPTLFDPAENNFSTTFELAVFDDTEYEWQVRAINAGGHGEWSAPASAAAVVAPNAPLNLTATRADSSVSLTWQRGAGGGTPTSYTVRARVAGTAPWTIQQSTVASSLTVSGLTNGTSYEFTVHAANAAGYSDASILASATPAAPPGPPEGPSLAPGDKSLTATWTAPADTGGLPVSSYEVRYKLSETSTWSTGQEVSGTNVVIDGLVNGSVYDVSVRAKNAAGVGGWSATATGKPATVPGAPAGLAATAGDSLINAVWGPPADNGGATISGYEVRIRVSGGAWGAATPVAQASRSFTGLTNGTAYEVGVRALNDQGPGEWAYALATPHPSGTGAPGDPTTLSARLATTGGAVALSWLAPTTGGAADGYEVRTCSQAVSGLCSSTQAMSASATDATITNALVGQYVRAEVRATSSSGQSAWVQSATLYSPSLTQPVMRIDTTGGAPIVSKETYLPATYSLDPNGSVSVPAASGSTEIRGRGNSTWNAPKKPYKIKLASSTVLINGVAKSKHWALLANYYDPSALRTAVAMNIGNQTGLAWTPHSQFVEVVLNGEYVGLYQLIETVRLDANRVNVTAMTSSDTAEPNVTGGYMIEIDGRLDGPTTNTFTTSNGADIVIQDPEIAEPEQKNYVKSYFAAFETTLYGSNFKDPVEGWRKYVDEPSLIDWYLVNEFLANNDAMYSSTDLYKQRGEKLKWGPLWDYDQSIGRGWGYHPPDAWWVRSGGLYGTMAPWFTRLFADDTFAANVKARWQQLQSVFAGAANYAGSIAPGLATAAGQSESIWPKLSAEQQGAETSFAAATPVVQSWLNQRYAWMNSAGQYGG